MPQRHQPAFTVEFADQRPDLHTIGAGLNALVRLLVERARREFAADATRTATTQEERDGHRTSPQ